MVGVFLAPFVNRMDKSVHLAESGASGTEVEVKVYDVDLGATDVERGFQKAFFAEGLFSEGNDFPEGDLVFREEGVSVGERFAALATVVDTVNGKRIVGGGLKIVQKIDVTIPVGGGVDFLEGDNVRLVLVDDGCDAVEVFENTLRGVEALVERESAAVGDVEGHQRKLWIAGRHE